MRETQRIQEWRQMNKCWKNLIFLRNQVLSFPLIPHVLKTGESCISKVMSFNSWHFKACSYFFPPWIPVHRGLWSQIHLHLARCWFTLLSKVIWGYGVGSFWRDDSVGFGCWCCGDDKLATPSHYTWRDTVVEKAVLMLRTRPQLRVLGMLLDRVTVGKLRMEFLSVSTLHGHLPHIPSCFPPGVGGSLQQ